MLPENAPLNSYRIPDGTHAREDFPKRDDQDWMKHTLAWVDAKGTVRLDYRPVHTYTLSKDIQYIEPTARIY
jgi:succinate dehydrogenase / fumarate reductase flavoprotein subunit